MRHSAPYYLACLAGAVLLASCSHKPGIVALSEPLAHSPLHKDLLRPSVFSARTKRTLRQEGLLHPARTDPAGAVVTIDTRLRTADSAALRVAGAEISVNRAQILRQEQPLKALGWYLTAIELTKPAYDWPDSDERATLVAVYNHACGEMAAVFHETGATRALDTRGPLRAYRLAWKNRGRATTSPGNYDTLRPANHLKVKGFDQRNTQDGYGGALVGFRAATPERRAADEFLPPRGQAVPLTALTRMPAPGRAELELHDLTVSDTVTIRGNTHRLAGDFTAPVATLADAAPRESTGIFGMFRPDKHEAEAGLFLAAPYDPERIPLILVHGLMSTPMTWREVINACFADPVLREHYQILVFYYPTGYPIAKNAAALRAKLKAFQKRFDPRGTNPNMKNTVMIGHSMGGILTSSQLRSSGDHVWNYYFEQPIDEIDLPADTREEVRDLFHFEANPNITRAIFVCAPHRGSSFANRPIGRLGSMLTKYPVRIADFATESLLGASTGFSRSILADPTDSIDDLKEGSTILKAFLELPMPRDPVLHTIAGDRGLPSRPGKSSDGLVPYASSHLDEAVSEKIVPSWHNATNHPETVAEITRILHLHLR